MNNHKHFYAAHSYMGLNFTYDSPCWSLYAFDTKKGRDEWLKSNKYMNGILVAEAVTVEQAKQLCTWLHNHPVHEERRGYYGGSIGRKVTHL